MSLCAVSGASAAVPDYDAVLARAMASSYGVAPDSLRAVAAVAEAEAANMLEGPEVEFEHLWPQSAGHIKWSAGVSQAFDWPGAYQARRAESAAMRDVSAAVLRSVTYDKAFAIKQYIVDIINARQRLAVYESIAEDLDSLAELVSRAYELGDGTILDLRKARIAVLDNRRELAALRADLSSLQSSLRAYGLDGEDVEQWTAYPPQPLVNPADDSRNYTELRALGAEYRAAGARARTAAMEAYPSFSVGYRHSYEEATHFNGFSVSMTLPSWGASRRRKAAALEAEALAAEIDAKTIELTSRDASTYTLALELAADISDFRDLSGDDSYLTLLRRAFDGGELTVLTYLNEINAFRVARLSYLDLVYRYNLALTSLNRYRSVYFE